jgi:hypothetical protein
MDHILEKGNKDSNPGFQPKSTVNHQQSKLENINMPIQTTIGVVTFANRLETIRNLNIGDVVSIIPEHDNPYDKNALAVYTNDQKMIGYIDKKLTDKLANKFVFTDKDYYTVTGKIIRFTRLLGETRGVEIEFFPPDLETKMKKAQDYIQKLKIERQLDDNESSMGDKTPQKASGHVDMEEVLIFFQQTVKSLVASGLSQEQAITKTMQMISQKFGPQAAQQLMMAAQQSSQGK